MELVRPTMAMIPRYHHALMRGFSPHNIDTEKVRLQQLALLESDPDELIAQMHDPEGKGPPFVRPDGSVQPRLPGVTRWMWDEGDFVGAINLRWQYGTSELPPEVPGHIGYTVAEWHRGKGHATSALKQILDEARSRGLSHVELTADEDNIASRRTIEKAGGTRIGRFDPGDMHHPCAQTILYRIAL